MKKKIVAAAIVLVLITVIVAKDKIIEIAVERVCTYILGTKLDIGKMKVGIIGGKIKIKDLKIYNPEGFEEPLMADIPGIRIKYKLFELLKQDIHLKELKIYLRQFNIVKNSAGEINVNMLRPIKKQDKGQVMEDEDKGKIPDIEIEEFYLKADKVFFMDYSKGDKPVVKEFNVNISKKYENIHDPYTLVRLIISQVIKNTTLAGVIKLPLHEASAIIGKAYDLSKNTATSFLNGTERTLGSLAGGLTSPIKGVFSTKNKSTEE